MKYTGLILSFALVLNILSTGCSENGDNHSKSDSLSLNAGEKWKVDSNMKVFMDQMIGDVDESASQSDIDYAALKGKLEVGTDGLISNCTMTGQAHEELHKWLIPFMETINRFDTDLSGEQKSDWLSEIRTSLAQFQQFFE